MDFYVLIMERTYDRIQWRTSVLFVFKFRVILFEI
jgi:hypothetical protein